MFCQLGKIQFKGANSFSAFSTEGEAVIVEHALISHKSRLQGTAIGLKSLNITVFLHQEFCNVAEEVGRLEDAKNAFTVLPLLWGNGKLEGNFVISSMGKTVTQMDDIGHLISATVSLTLKESDIDSLNAQQQQAQRDAFAVGDKNPPAKSNRKNPVGCSKKVANVITIIKSNAAAVDKYSIAYANDTTVNYKMVSHLEIIMQNCTSIVNATAGSCVSQTPGLTGAAIDTRHYAGLLQITVKENIALYVKPIYVPNQEKIKSQNQDLQASVKRLAAAANSIIKSVITKT